MKLKMQVKVFMDSKPSALEAAINAWLDQIGRGAVVKTETSVVAVADKPGDGTHPCIVTTVWYEPGSD
jgi:hypothetical protein